MKNIFLTIFAVIGLNGVASADFESLHFPKETIQVRRFLKRHEVFRVTNYCIVGQLNCRSLVQYKNKKSGEIVSSFEDRFLVSNSTRSVASRSFFLEKSNGNFKVLAQDRYQNKIRINIVDELNQNVSVDFDADMFPTYTVRFFKVGTEETLQATLKFRSNTAEFTGDLSGVWIVKP